MCTNTIRLCVSVDEDEEYECVTVLNAHTQDVKHVAWHPKKEVAPDSLHANHTLAWQQAVTELSVYTASGFSQLWQQHLHLQRGRRRLGVPGHLAGPHIHSVEFVFRCLRGEDGLLQWWPHREDLERVSQREWARWVHGGQQHFCRRVLQRKMNNFLSICLFKGNLSWKCVCTLSGYHGRTVYDVAW